MESEYEQLFDKYVKSDTLKMHCMEVEAIMRELAQKLGEDEEKWAIAGLMHDVDCDIEPNIKNQGRKAVEILKEETDCPVDVCQAILAHNEENLGVKRESKFDYALSATDNISGLIYAYALMKNSLDIKVNKLKKKLNDKRFAATVRRDLIFDIEKTGMELDVFLGVAINAMRGISNKLGFYDENKEIPEKI